MAESPKPQGTEWADFGVDRSHIAARNPEVFAGATREDAVQHLIGRQTDCAADIFETRALQGSLLERVAIDDLKACLFSTTTVGGIGVDEDDRDVTTLELKCEFEPQALRA